METTIELIDGVFSKEDALQLIQAFVHAKIKFHEAKISRSDALEDVQAREKKIKKLSETLQNVRKMLEDKNQCELKGIVTLK